MVQNVTISKEDFEEISKTIKAIKEFLLAKSEELDNVSNSLAKIRGALEKVLKKDLRIELSRINEDINRTKYDLIKVSSALNKLMEENLKNHS